MEINSLAAITNDCQICESPGLGLGFTSLFLQKQSYAIISAGKTASPNNTEKGMFAQVRDQTQ